MAVYTQLSQADIEGLLAQYDIGALKSFEPIAEGVTNTNYLLTLTSPSPLAGEGRGGGQSHASTPHPNLPPQGGKGCLETKYILTLFEKHFELSELPYFTALMQWWHARGISCPQPIQNKSGGTLCALKEKPALIVSFLEGNGIKNILPEHLLQLGTLAAKMHISAMDFPHTRENHLSLQGWEKIIDDIIERVDEIEPGLKKLIAEEYNYLSDNWPSDLPRGTIHADLFPDNVFFTKALGKKAELSGVIDFYFSCNDFWAYDLAIIINSWCFDERHRLVKERMQALFAGYNEIRSMSSEEEAAFSLLLRGSALRFLLTRSYDWLNRDEGALVNVKDPLEYARKLRWWKEDDLMTR